VQPDSKVNIGIFDLTVIERNTDEIGETGNDNHLKPDITCYPAYQVYQARFLNIA
jgi:hypothetical protein